MKGRNASGRAHPGSGRVSSAVAAAVASLLFAVGASAAQPPGRTDSAAEGAADANAPAGECAKIWLGREAEFEEMLRTAEVVEMKDIGVGVLESQCAYVEDGLPFRRMCWKTIKKRKKAGFWENYKSEIAAYELDKFLGLDMVPPTVERYIGGTKGSAQMWLEDIEGWDMKNPVQGPDTRAWAREMVRGKMFDRLIGNIDRNQQNLLYDHDWCFLLIDHSRAFVDVTDPRQFQETKFYDLVLWAKMKTLDLETLKPVLGEWVSTGMMRAMLQRRDQMAEEIAELAKTRGGNIWLR
jgi:hypothetical protein